MHKQTYPFYKAYMNAINTNMLIYLVSHRKLHADLVVSTAQSVLKHDSGTYLLPI